MCFSCISSPRYSSTPDSHNKKKKKNSKNVFYGVSSFYGLDDGYINESWQGPDPINLRYYLQRTIREEIDKEYISSGSSSPLSKSGKKYNKIREQWFNLLQVFVEKTSTPEKITILLNSIKDVIEKGFYKYD